jgi:hypothetical protein
MRVFFENILIQAHIWGRVLAAVSGARQTHPLSQNVVDYSEPKAAGRQAARAVAGRRGAVWRRY